MKREYIHREMHVWNGKKPDYPDIRIVIYINEDKSCVAFADKWGADSIGGFIRTVTMKNCQEIGEN